MGIVAGYFEQGNEKDGKFLDYLNTYYLLQKGSTVWILLV
jgi:hypothetical protein